MKRFDDLCAAIRKQLKIKSAVLDGEIVALDESGNAGLLSFDAETTPSDLFCL
jgi:ATP-dependent DNA ligase